MQSRFTVGILVLQAEGLVCVIRYLGFLFQTTPAGIVAEPQYSLPLMTAGPLDAGDAKAPVAGLAIAHRLDRANPCPSAV